jgi:hypothetical protein
MMRAGVWLLAFLAVSAALYGGLEAIKASSFAAGAATVRADVERARADAVAAAVAQAERTRAELERRSVAAEVEAARAEIELKEMRDELAKRGGDDPVVFGPEWACWMRGGAEKCTVATNGR